MNLPIDNNGNVASAGTQEFVFRARADGSGEFFLTDGTFQEIILPTGSNCTLVYIQVRKVTPVTFDPQEDCLPFEFSHDGVEDGILCPPEGCSISIKKVAGESLGFIKAAAGYKVIAYALGEDAVVYDIPSGSLLVVDGVQVTHNGYYVYVRE